VEQRGLNVWCVSAMICAEGPMPTGHGSVGLSKCCMPKDPQGWFKLLDMRAG
jgi:hypothetical protein